MTSLDTNVVLRFLLNDVPQQYRVAKALIDSQEVHVSDAVVIEAVHVQEKMLHMPRTDIKKLLRAFLSLPNVNYNRNFLADSLSLYDLHPKLSIVDCYVACEAAAHGNHLVTFDKKLAAQGGGHVSNL